MGEAPRRDFYCVRKEIGDDVERFHGTTRATGQIDDQRALANSGLSTRKNGARIFLAAFLPHPFAETRQDFFADGRRRFRRGVTRADSGAAGGENDVHGIGSGKRGEAFFERGAIVGKSFAGNDLPTEGPAALGHSRSGAVLALAAGDRIADGDDRDAHQRDSSTNKFHTRSE